MHHFRELLQFLGLLIESLASLKDRLRGSLPHKFAEACFEHGLGALLLLVVGNFPGNWVVNHGEELLLVMVPEERATLLYDATAKSLLLVELHLRRESRRQLLLFH